MIYSSTRAFAAATITSHVLSIKQASHIDLLSIEGVFDKVTALPFATDTSFHITNALSLLAQPRTCS